MATRMQQRRGTAAQWTSTNSGNGPILEVGEIGFESDTGKFKIGDGVNNWATLSYFVDADTLVDGAPGLLNTLNELAAAIGDDPSFFTTVAANLSNHEADTTNIHGIANTAELATKTFAAELLTNATKSNIVITGDKNGLTITAENGVADSTTDNLTEGSTNKYFTDERAQDAIGNNLGTGLSYDDSTGAVSVTANTYDPYGSASSVAGDLSSHESATTNVHGILDTDDLATKTYVADAITNATVDQSALAGTGIDWNIVSEQFDIDSTVVTLNGAQTLTNKTITSPSGLVKDDVGLANVDNTSDANKPVSTATQTALDLKANLASPTFTGTVTTDDLEIGGSLTFSGTATEISSTTTVIEDPLIYLADGNPGNINDLGFVANYNDGTYAHTGLVRDASAGTWKLFKGVTDEPTNTVNFSQGTLDDLAINSLSASSITVGDVSNTEFGYLNGVTSNIQTQIDGKSPTAGNTSLVTLGTVTSGTWSADTIAINKGGTGATTASEAAAALLPSQSSNSGKYLTTDGSGTLSWGTVTGYSAPTLGSTSIASGATVTTVSDLTLSSPTVTGTLSLPNTVLVTTGSTTLSANTATTIDTNALSSFTTAEYTLSLKQGSKIRSSKVIVQTDGTSVDMTEFAITETGTAMSGVVVSATASGSDAVLQVTVTDAASTNVAVKFSEVRF